MKYVCPHGCETDIGMSEIHQRQGERCAVHSELFVYAKQLRRSAPPRQVSEKREVEAKRHGSTLKRGRGFAAHPKQQAKVRDLPCIVCGRDRHEATIDPAHVYPRRLASCECADGVVPLCGACHDRYDDPNQHLDLLPVLVNRGYRTELVHAVVAHEAPLRELMEQVTGVRWEPVGEREAVA